MSTPSLRLLPFNTALLSLYRYFLSLICRLDKMASAASEQSGDSGFTLSHFGELEQHISGRQSLIVARHGYHTQVPFGVSKKRAKLSHATIRSPCQWLLLSLKPRACLFSEQLLAGSAADDPASFSTPEFAAFGFISAGFQRGFTHSPWKFTAWLGGKERRIRLWEMGWVFRWSSLMWIQETRCLRTRGHRVGRRRVHIVGHCLQGLQISLCVCVRHYPDC